MPAAIRTIGRPTGDPVEDARRLERSTWWALLDARATVAAAHPESVMASVARCRVCVTENAWAAALRDLDAIQYPRRPVAGTPDEEPNRGIT